MVALIHIGGKTYELIHENKNGWNAEAFRDRFSDVLERYDYIVGDWGYNQLRLKGFFKDSYQKAAKDSIYSCVPDYINEYCNFGCAYFILEKKQSTRKEPEDYDLELDYDKPRLEGADIRAAAEAALNESAEAEEMEDELHDLAVPNVRQRSSNGNQSRESNGRNNGGTARRENQHRRGYRGNDHRGKKPIKLAANEAVAVTLDSNYSKKDAGHS